MYNLIDRRSDIESLNSTSINGLTVEILKCIYDCGLFEKLDGTKLVLGVGPIPLESNRRYYITHDKSGIIMSVPIG